jgi:putative endopeptidase
MKKYLRLVALLGIFACGNETKIENKNDAVASNADTSIRPQDDFFAFANGLWIKNNPIPAEESGWGIGNLVYKENYERLRKINEDAAKEKADKGSVSQKIGSFWRTAMDTVAIEKAGIEAIKPLLDSINAIKTNTDLVNCMALLSKNGINQFIGSYVGQDDKNSSLVLLKFWQAGLNLPEREYYLNADKENEKIRTAYINYINQLFKLVNYSGDAQKILALETQIAKTHRTLAATRDSEKNYYKMSLSQFAKYSKNIDLKAFVNKINAKNIDSVILGQPEYYQSFDKIFTPQNLPTIKAISNSRAK